MELEQLSGRNPTCPDRNARYRSRATKFLLETAFGILTRADPRCNLELSRNCSQWIVGAAVRVQDDEAVTCEEVLYEQAMLP